MKTQVSQSKQAKQSLLSLLLTVIIPAFLLMKLGVYTSLSPLSILAIALSFPGLYGLYELKTVDKISFLSIFGFVSVLLTGGVAALNLPPHMIAIKESLIPFVIAVIILVSAQRGKPALTFVLQGFFNFEKIEQELKLHKKHKYWSKILLNATYILCASFMLSSFLNYTLASIIVTSPTGSIAFNEELGLLTALSYPVIAIPSMTVMMGSIWYVVHQVKKYTSLTFVEMLKEELV